MGLSLRHPDDDEVIHAGGLNQEVLDELKHAVAPENAPESGPVKDASAATELEGDWHLVAVTHYEHKVRPATNLTIRGDRFITEAIESEMAWSFTRDSNSKTIQWTRLLGETRKPPLVEGNIGASYRHGTYDLQGDVLTIHEQEFNSTFVWKRGHRELPSKAVTVPEGVAIFGFAGDEAATGEGQLMPGDFVDVTATFSQGDNKEQQRVVVERVEVDALREKRNDQSQRLVKLLVTNEQADLLHETWRRGSLKLVLRKPGDDTLQHPGGINPQVLVEMQAAAGADPESPLAGKWHLSSEEVDGNITGERINLSIHGDVWQRKGIGNSEESIGHYRIWVKKDQRSYVVTDWPLINGRLIVKESGSYEINDDSLILRPSGEHQIVQVWKKGHRKLIGPLAPATEAQKLRWRSGVVEIFVDRDNPREVAERPLCHGVLVSTEGLILCQFPEYVHIDPESKDKFLARFDDGSDVKLTMVEDAGGGWYAFKPAKEVRVNHFFPLASSPPAVADDVHVWGMDRSNVEPTVCVNTSKIMLLDRRIASIREPVWQLSKPDRIGGAAESLLVLSADGELLAITPKGTGDLLLAIPVKQLRAMFPKAFPGTAETPAEQPQAGQTLPSP